MIPSGGYSLNPTDQAKLKAYLVNSISREIEARPPSPRQRREAIQQYLQQAYESTRLNLPEQARNAIFKEILDEMLGFGPIQPLLDDPTISEVMVNGPNMVYIEKNGKLTLTDIHFENDDAVLRVIDKIILPLGRNVDIDNPTVDARLPDGSRVNAVIPPVAIDGPSITIRKFMKDKLTMDQLISLGSITRGMAEMLRACVVSRLNILVSGGTGSGKTTFLNILSGYIPANERIVTIEDAAELKLQQPHVVRLETKPPNSDGQHAVSIRDLVRNSLRMRPDRIIVGECRGGEALDMLQAMNTGHDGSLTTLHANTPRDAVSRLETMCLMSGLDLPVKVLREQIAAAIDLIVQQARLKDGTRKITAITEVSGMEGDTITMTDIFKYQQTGVQPDGTIIGELRPTGIRPGFSQRLEAAGYRLGPEIFGANLNEMLGNRRR
ncbi:type II secretion system protein E [Leptolinea tardivitalis]|uniref:Type II secretion system protein E n=1 Tax=Leptolinea tardivitalis TaxID=229920 RepID=A0A0P6WP07_9CHLR|nr:CpaF family protein [Leptolinea tardivitalis]KPL71761.1 type II secretion system protein E [Leptolinea tardivitalis]GAP20132.1 Flp pilus assembly protein, ATPase CpaF [Leptolinea tardivitalis]